MDGNREEFIWSKKYTRLFPGDEHNETSMNSAPAKSYARKIIFPKMVASTWVESRNTKQD